MKVLLVALATSLLIAGCLQSTPPVGSPTVTSVASVTTPSSEENAPAASTVTPTLPTEQPPTPPDGSAITTAPTAPPPTAPTTSPATNETSPTTNTTSTPTPTATPPPPPPPPPAPTCNMPTDRPPGAPDGAMGGMEGMNSSAMAACMWDLGGKGVPKFVTSLHIALKDVQQVSRFRSGAGHDYNDRSETCRSMKHYFWLAGGTPGSAHSPAWTSIELHAPFNGTVIGTPDDGGLGQQMWLRPDDATQFTVLIFHTTAVAGVTTGTHVTSGQLIAHHATDATMDDVAVRVMTPQGMRFVSYFDAMTDDALAQLASHGIATRNEIVLTKEYRDAHPLTCSGETITGGDHSMDWVALH